MNLVDYFGIFQKFKVFDFYLSVVPFDRAVTIVTHKSHVIYIFYIKHTQSCISVEKRKQPDIYIWLTNCQSTQIFVQFDIQHLPVIHSSQSLSQPKFSGFNIYPKIYNISSICSNPTSALECPIDKDLFFNPFKL